MAECKLSASQLPDKGKPRDCYVQTSVMSEPLGHEDAVGIILVTAEGGALDETKFLVQASGREEEAHAAGFQAEARHPILGGICLKMVQDPLAYATLAIVVGDPHRLEFAMLWREALDGAAAAESVGLP